MDKKTLEKFIKDAAGFLYWCSQNGGSKMLIAGTLSHDIWGLYRGVECFSPRVSGYAKHLPK